MDDEDDEVITGLEVEEIVEVVDDDTVELVETTEDELLKLVVVDTTVDEDVVGTAPC